MWKSANTILHRQTLKVLPKHSSLDTLCSSLCRQTLCKTDLKNCRPISNISFLSRLLEKVVANRLHEHIYSHHLSNDLQSAYKRFHSTKTALLKIHNDIVDNMDNGKVTALTLLDLSAAFLFWVESSKISLIQIKHTYYHIIITGTKQQQIGSSTIFKLNCLAVIHSHQILFVI